MASGRMASWHSWTCAILIAYCLVSSVAKAGSRRQLTTRSWDSLGFHENIPRSPMEDQIIIAVVDTGIWPESPSFSDQGLGPPPAKWKGVCDPGFSTTFKCNNKIIGARVYIPDPEDSLILTEFDDKSPRDTDGHGTHIAATLAGVVVRNVSMNGVGLGTARGAVPRARLAIYKVCWNDYCKFRTMGVADAIKDGVDIISMSNGGGSGAWPYNIDDRAPSYFGVMKAGLFLATSAGNNVSFTPFTVGNTMPWVTTVGNSAGAGTDYITYVNSGDGKRFPGSLLNTALDGKTMYPLVRNEEVLINSTDPILSQYCISDNINPELVKGKIILCQKIPKRIAYGNFDNVGCAALLVEGSSGLFEFRRDHTKFVSAKTPVIVLTAEGFKHLLQYYNDSKASGQPATASIEKTISAPDTTPARISTSSARGPSLVDLSILKPDVCAPGANLIAAVPGAQPTYMAMSGTSMATPFLSGIAAYIKSFHPTWSPAAIRSAIMTTATPMVDPYRNEGELAYGAGQISPVQANDPGLIYDAGELDYVKHLCILGNFSSEFIYSATGSSSYDCSKMQIEKGWTLNYPSFFIPAVTDQPFVSVFQRTVTNVGNSSTANYKAIVNAPPALNIKVEPTVLAFTQVGEALNYTLTVEGKLAKTNTTRISLLSASIVWSDGVHQVRSPIAVFERPADMEAEILKVVGQPFPKHL